LIRRVDHLVYATPDVDSTCADLERRFGVRASVGGRHVGRGTRNALIAIGPAAYLEIIGPDLGQAAVPRPPWFGIDTLTAPRLITWAVAETHLDRLVGDAAQRGVQLGAITAGRRERSDGVVLTWQATDPNVMLAGGLVPFFIDWGASPHPASNAASGPRLEELHGEHPDPQQTLNGLAAVGVAMRVDFAATPALVATLRTADGPAELR
jgi:Glyoxalase-like domain